jgi:DNA polymerase IIIc chi subunit
LFTLVLARDQAQAEELDELLWAFDNDAYIPHQIAGEDMDEEEALVLIAVPGTDAPARPLVINLRDDPAGPVRTRAGSGPGRSGSANRCANAGASTRPPVTT